MKRRSPKLTPANIAARSEIRAASITQLRIANQIAKLRRIRIEVVRITESIDAALIELEQKDNAS